MNMSAKLEEGYIFAVFALWALSGEHIKRILGIDFG